MKEPVSTVEEYISSFPPDVQAKLRKIRNIITETAPATETISYGMPAYKSNKKPLIYFAAFSHHIGLYATPRAHEKFAAELSGYKKGKGSVQFPLSDEIPYNLITEIVKFKLNENQQQ